MESTQRQEEVISLYLGASGEWSGRMALSVGNTIIFRQISQLLHGYLFWGLCGEWHNFPEIFGTTTWAVAWPTVEGLHFELKYKPVVMALWGGVLSKSLSLEDLVSLLVKRDQLCFSKDLVVLWNHPDCLLKLKYTMRYTQPTHTHTLPREWLF